MARHLMAVCVVCLLCADRLPCQEHFESITTTASNNTKAVTTGIDQSNNNNNNYNNNNNNIKMNNNKNSAMNGISMEQSFKYPYKDFLYNFEKNSYPDKYETNTKYGILHHNDNDDGTNNVMDNGNNSQQQQENNKNEQHKKQHHHHHHNNNLNITRHKRHAGHAHDAPALSTSSTLVHQRPKITEEFLQRIFDEFGQGDGTINIENFQNILRQLGLHSFLDENSLMNWNQSKTDKDTKSDTTAISDSGSCISDNVLMQQILQPSTKSDIETNSHKHNDEKEISNCKNNTSNAANAQNLCTNLSTTTISSATASATATATSAPTTTGKDKGLFNYKLTEQDLMNVCPILIYHLTAPLEIQRKGCIEPSLLDSLDHHNTLSFVKSQPEEYWIVWVYAFISVLACSILGLVGVAIIPFMDSRYYKHIIQFLVSLAVGTMTGDALLHLLPHSLAGQTESNMIFKGLTCMGGIIFFYITEHSFTMISEWRKGVAKKETTKNSKWPRAKVVRDPDSNINTTTVGDKLCKSKYSSYPYCYDEIAMDTKNDTWLHLPNNATEMNFIYDKSTERKRINKNGDGGDVNETAIQSLLSDSYMYKNIDQIGDMNHHQQQHNHHHHHQNLQKHNHNPNAQLQIGGHQLPDSNAISKDLDGTSMIGDGNSLMTTTSTTTTAPATSGINGNSGGQCNPSIVDGSNGGNGIVSSTTAGNNINKNKLGNNETVTVILREHEASHHGHSHKHGHVHSPPESLSAVAWMIIMGDGLHNFTDGMAIGAAFAENVAGGFSTSLAVFCHELPHELGDFAILMKAGMSVRSAVYYNLLTGVLSFIGMIVGLVFGRSQETAQWLFAAAAGLFIYIALVDMMPEISAAHKSLQQFALQILGILSGVLLMLLIAIYEGDLMSMFDVVPNEHQH